jgi:predicted DNA-binding transcriptional regulator AlpA
MHAVAFEQILADEWAVERSDVYETGIAPPSVLRDAPPLRPFAVLRAMGISTDEFIALLRTGRLGRPRELGHGHVAWRADEIVAAVDWLNRDD